MCDASGDDLSAPKTITEDLLGCTHKTFLDRESATRSERKAGTHSAHVREVVDVHRDALELSNKRTQECCSCRHRYSCCSFNCLAECECVRCCHISRNTLDEWKGFCDRFPFKKFLYAFVCEEEFAFKLDDAFTCNTETEMPRFNDAGMDRPDRNFKYAISLNLAHGKFLVRYSKLGVPFKIFAQWVCAIRNILVMNKAAKIGMSFWGDTEHIVHITLIPV